MAFPSEYPRAAPTVRFLVPIRHPNFSPNGRVCHSVLGKNDPPQTTVVRILECIYGLLLHPEFDDAIDSTIALDYAQSPGTYELSVVDHTMRFASAPHSAWVNYFTGATTTMPTPTPTPGTPSTPTGGSLSSSSSSSSSGGPGMGLPMGMSLGMGLGGSIIPMTMGSLPIDTPSTPSSAGSSTGSSSTSSGSGSGGSSSSSGGAAPEEKKRDPVLCGWCTCDRDDEDNRHDRAEDWFRSSYACTRCNQVRYCSRICMQADRTHHKARCFPSGS